MAPYSVQCKPNGVPSGYHFILQMTIGWYPIGFINSQINNVSIHQLSNRQCLHSPTLKSTMSPFIVQYHPNHQINHSNLQYISQIPHKYKKLLTYNFVETLIEDFAKKNNLLEWWWVGKCSTDEVKEVKEVEDNADFLNF